MHNPDLSKIAQGLHPLERAILPHLLKEQSLEGLVKASGKEQIEVMRALQWLSNKGMLTIQEKLHEMVRLGENAEKYREVGLPEKRFLLALKGKMSLAQIKDAAGLNDEECAVCMGILRKRGLIRMEKVGGELLIESAGESGNEFIEEAFLQKKFPLVASHLNEEEKIVLRSLMARKNFLHNDVQKEVSVQITESGRALCSMDIDANIAERLTAQMLASGEWKDLSYRRYDVLSQVPHIYGGRRHFVEQAIRYIRRIWLDMGFKEMKGNVVQTAFWDLDALFVPQDHPAREMQDTFYVKEPAIGKLPHEIMEKVRASHLRGEGSGSRGWGAGWSQSVACQNLLRTHTTVLSAKTLSKLKKTDIPAKYFTVGRVYRNEALSWKHLFEFTQVEGIVIDPDANFKNLKGYLMEFFQKMGFEKIRIRPGHFPYTEPSAEVDVYHPIKKKWVELGGSGIFRPEVVVPLLGEDIPVLAWGLGLERSILEYYGFDDVRTLYQNDLKIIRESKLWMK